MRTLNPLQISASTLTTCLGLGKVANWQAIVDQRNGLKLCQFETVTLPTYVGEIPALDLMAVPPHLGHFDCRNNRLAEIALQQDGFLDAVETIKSRYGAQRVGVFMGTSTSGILHTELAYRQRDSDGALPEGFAYAQTHNTYSVADYVRTRCAIQGPAWVVSSACSSGAKVFANAQRMVSAGLIDAAIVGGVDTLCLTTLYGFASLQLTAQSPCQPFGANRTGISIAEAAGFAILERISGTAAPDVTILLAAGESSDAHHMSSPQPQGLGALAAMRSALEQAELSSQQIDYVNLHGTATPSNDAAEDQAMIALFGDQVACSSSKGATGHTLGAAGAIEAIICEMALQHQMMPGGLNTSTLDPLLKSNYLLNNQSKTLKHVMNNSFGFGGSNCSLIFTQLQWLKQTVGAAL